MQYETIQLEIAHCPYFRPYPNRTSSNTQTTDKQSPDKVEKLKLVED